MKELGEKTAVKNETEEKRNAQSGHWLTVKRVLKVLSLLCLIFVFCPSFLVSCSGQKVDVSVITAVEGVSTYGTRLVEPHPAMLICIVIPIAMFALLMSKKISDRKIAASVFACSLVDTVIWMLFRSTVKRIAEENYCSFKTTGWFAANMIALLAIAFLTIINVLKKPRMNEDLLRDFSADEIRGSVDSMIGKASQVSNAIVQKIGQTMTNRCGAAERDIIGYI